VLPYLAYYAFFLLPFVYFWKDKETFKKISHSFIIVFLISSVIFIFFQTTTVRPIVVPGSFLNDLVLMVYSVDMPTNCLPSLHTAVSTLVLLSFWKYERKYALPVFAMSVLVILSTLFIKQHNILDLVAAITISTTVFYAVEKKLIS
jgi:membrane-associated phospholipid phosphatase